MTILVTESTRFILEVNVMSQSNFSVKVNGQTVSVKVNGEPAQEQSFPERLPKRMPLLALQGCIK